MDTAVQLKNKAPSTIGGRIKNAREAIKINGKPMSIRELARRLGVSHAAVSQWESGDTQNLKIDNLIKLRKELRRTQDYFLYGKEGGQVDMSDKAVELAHAWDDMPDGEWKQRVYYFVTTFLVFQKQLLAEENLRRDRRDKRRSPRRHN